MSQTRLAGIFGLLPGKEQQDALLHGIELVFARGEWGLCEELCGCILQMQGNEGLKTSALLQAIKAALRLRKIDAAFEQAQLLAEVDEQNGEALLRPFFRWLRKYCLKMRPGWRICGKPAIQRKKMPGSCGAGQGGCSRNPLQKAAIQSELQKSGRF